ncbi:MAG: hypothetical protein WCA91_12520 [Candidatus Acidiferrales bacterium]
MTVPVLSLEKVIEKDLQVDPTKPTKSDPMPVPVRDGFPNPQILRCPTLPQGVRLIRWEPKPPPVAIDVCSIVVDLSKFVESELRALDSRLNHPWTIRGGFTVSQMLDRLAQAGLEVELEPKGGEIK